MMPTEAPAQPLEPPTRRSRTRTLLVVLGVLVTVGALVVVFGGRFGVDPLYVPSPLIGEPMPSLELPYLDREGTLDFDELRGAPVVVNFWASWCLACREEHPHLNAVAAEYADRGVRFVGVLYQDRPATGRAFLDEMGWGGENYDYVVDVGSRAGIEFGVYGIPETFIVDARGIITGKITGPATGPALRAALEEAFAAGG